MRARSRYVGTRRIAISIINVSVTRCLRQDVGEEKIFVPLLDRAQKKSITQTAGSFPIVSTFVRISTCWRIRPPLTHYLSASSLCTSSKLPFRISQVRFKTTLCVALSSDTFRSLSVRPLLLPSIALSFRFILQMPDAFPVPLKVLGIAH
jgi:hypothetical protein